MKACRLIGPVSLAVATLVVAARAQADALLKSVDFALEGECAQVHVRLGMPVRSESTNLAGTASLITLPVEVIAGDDKAPGGGTLRAPDGNPADLRTITGTAGKSGAMITIQFSKPVAYRLIMEAETKHIRIDTGPNCKNETAAESTSPPDQGTTVDAARRAIADRNFGKARAILTTLQASADPQTREIADEFLGVVHENEGDLSAAKSQYELYISRYPKSLSATRVKQRLADVLTAMAASESGSDTETEPPDALRTNQKSNSTALADNRPNLRGSIDDNTSLRTLRNIKDPKPDPEKWTWKTYGGIGQSYYRQDEFDAGHGLEDSRLISSLSVQAKGENRDWDMEARLDGLNQTEIGIGDNASKTSLSTAYVETRNKKTDLIARLGRQTRNDGGIFGRFDGAWLQMPMTETVDVALAAGSPVYARDQLPFEDEVFFGSARATIDLQHSNWFADIYAIEQHAGEIVDRRAIGSELRYESQGLAAYIGADYDIHLNKMSSAYVSGTWQVNDRTVVNGSIDYRTMPFLLTSNALSGQTVDELPSLVRLLGENQVIVLAGDRTSDAVTAALGVSYQISQQWQLAFDGLWMDMSGTPASGGVEAIEGQATDIYVSAYAYGAGIFDASDSAGGGIAFSDSGSSSRLTADIFWRYPWNEQLTLAPRLRASVKFKDSQTSIRISPSLATRYRVSKHWLLESELGLALDSDDAGQAAEVQAIIGYRYEF